MIQLRIEAEIADSKKDEFEQSVHYIIQTKLQKYAGNNRRVFRDIGQEQVIKYTEEWENMEQLKNYLASDDFQCLMGAMNVLGDILSAVIWQADKVEDIKENT